MAFLGPDLSLPPPPRQPAPRIVSPRETVPDLPFIPAGRGLPHLILIVPVPVDRSSTTVQSPEPSTNAGTCGTGPTRAATVRATVVRGARARPWACACRPDPGTRVPWPGSSSCRASGPLTYRVAPLGVSGRLSRSRALAAMAHGPGHRSCHAPGPESRLVGPRGKEAARPNDDKDDGTAGTTVMNGPAPVEARAVRRSA